MRLMVRASIGAIAVLAVPTVVGAQQKCSSIQDDKGRLACFDQMSKEAAVQPQKPKQAATNEGGGLWDYKQKKDSFNDKMSCMITPKDRGHIQFTNAEVYLSYRGQGGVSSFKFRFDDEPPSELHLATSIQKQIGAFSIEGRDFSRLLRAKRLRTETLTVLSSIKQEDISLVGLAPLHAKMVAACPKD